jgi:short-subunit dehydrogenase
MENEPMSHDTVTDETNLAVVTGASSGIGFALATHAAKHGFDLIICAEDEGIAGKARELSKHGTQVKAVRADLARADGVEQLAKVIELSGRPVEALMLNAGVGVGGAFLDNKLEDELRMIALNVTSTVHLAKLVLPAMVARKRGKVLVTASVASTAPTPFMCIYGATKAFDLSFAEGLRVELAPHGITVTALQPGATDTSFFERAGMENTKVGQGSKDDPMEVARLGFEAMMAGKDAVVGASLKSKLVGAVNEILPESVKAKLQARETQPHPGKSR